MTTHDSQPGQREVPDELTAAYRFVESMVPRADITNPYPAWYGWALREAYLAGLRAQPMADNDLSAERLNELASEVGYRRLYSPWFEGAIKCDELLTLIAAAREREVLAEVLTIEKDVRSGQPTLKNTRIPASMILAELAEGFTVAQVADDRSLSPQQIIDMLKGLGAWLDSINSKPSSRGV